MTNKTTSISKNRFLFNIAVPWISAMALLILYYAFIEIPMEQSFIKGVNYLNQNKVAEASAEFEKVLRIYPVYEPVYLNVANYCLKNGKIKEGRARYNRALRLCLIKSEIFSERALVYALYTRNLNKGTALYNKQVINNYFSTLFQCRKL